MNDEFERMRDEINTLKDERDALLGYVSGLFQAVAAIIQTHPRHADVNLAISLLQDARDAGRITIDLEGPEGRPYAGKLLDALLALKPYEPGALQSRPGMNPR